MAGHEDKQASKDKYETPSVSELQRLLMVNRKSTGHVNEVWPNIYIGDAYTARDKGTLLNLGITHIVNAAHGIYHINTGAKYYSDTQMHYLGVEADDDPEFDLSPFFYPTAKFIRAGLNSPKGKVFVNCAMGVSRSATLVLAYLMICKNVTLLEAIKAVCEHRDVFPNSGFLSQLRQLDLALTLERRKKKKPQ
ncbi:dual specificity protein phosphatase 13-like [Acipenser ruthenus]|uniref:dual specificity protein phosphatase 13-like n=1 Tax=Acipenser ruthenus TaxID=7906 RepID=UPI00145B4BA6|nr:dual specificity protein phosphatase 13-like [Acipenser ruthenus]